MDMQIKLKPCPFCGCPAELYIIPKEENPEWYKGGEFWRVRCSSEFCLIGHSIKLASEKEVVIAEWNSRKRKNKLAFEIMDKEKDNG